MANYRQHVFRSSWNQIENACIFITGDHRSAEVLIYTSCILLGGEKQMDLTWRSGWIWTDDPSFRSTKCKAPCHTTWDVTFTYFNMLRHRICFMVNRQILRRGWEKNWWITYLLEQRTNRLPRLVPYCCGWYWTHVWRPEVVLVKLDRS